MKKTIVFVTLQLYFSLDAMSILSKAITFSPDIKAYASTSDDIRMFARRTGDTKNYSYSGYVYDIKGDEYLARGTDDSVMKKLWELLEGQYCKTHSKKR